MSQVGLSPALGTFLAGVVLATSEYRHELEADIEPFKGLLLGLFFISVGASIDFGLIGNQPGTIAGLTATMIVAKLAVLLVLGRLFGLGVDQTLVFGFALPQAGEFAFVLFSFANQEGVLDPATTSPLVASVALSMALTPLLMIANERLLLPHVGTKEVERAPDDIEERNAVLIAGFGDFGATVGRLLRAKGVGATVMDVDPDRVDLLRRLGFTVYYGDASRVDLLETAGAGQARIIVLATDRPSDTLDLVHNVRKHFPHLVIFARARAWQDANELLEAGAHHVYRQSLDSGLRMGADVLRAMGFRAYNVERSAQVFLRHDEESLHDLAGMRSEEGSDYLSAARQRIEDLEAILLGDLADPAFQRDDAWDPESLRADFGG